MKFAMKTSTTGLATALALSGALLAGAADAALVNNSNGTVSDTSTGLMWAEDANAFATIYNGTAAGPARQALMNTIIAFQPTGVDPMWGAYNLTAGDWDLGVNPYTDIADGHMTYFAANAFVKYANSINYKGYNDWRLPTKTPLVGTVFNYIDTNDFTGISDAGYNFTNTAGGRNPANDELSNLYYNSMMLLGLLDYTGTSRPGGTFSLDTAGAINPFLNVERAGYHTATVFNPYGVATDGAPPDSLVPATWNINFSSGYAGSKDRVPAEFGGFTEGVTWLVRDATVVPVPGAVWLFGSALVGLIGRGRKKVVA